MNNETFMCTMPCREAYNPSSGIMGLHAEEKRVMIVLHRADDRILNPALFSSGHEQALAESDTGKAIYQVLSRVGLEFEDVFITNLFKCLLPGQRTPTGTEYETCLPHLVTQVDEFRPSAIIACGREVYQYMFREEAKIKPFSEARGQVLKYRGNPTLITFHPSGWKRRKESEARTTIVDFLREYAL